MKTYDRFCSIKPHFCKPSESQVFWITSSPILQIGANTNKLILFSTINSCSYISFTQCAQADDLLFILVTVGKQVLEIKDENLILEVKREKTDS